VSELTEKAMHAQAALQAYEAKLGLDPEKEKTLQVDVAKANAMVRKLEKALATAEEPKDVEAELVKARSSQTKATDALTNHQANLKASPISAQES
jgi:multidrug resistance efflux pump